MRSWISVDSAVKPFTTLTSGNTITWDAEVSTNAKITLANFANQLTVVNAREGMHFTLIINSLANDSVRLLPLDNWFGPEPNLDTWIPNFPSAENYIFQFFYDGTNFQVITQNINKQQLDVGDIVGDRLQGYYDAELFQENGNNSVWPPVDKTLGEPATVIGDLGGITLESEQNINPSTGLPVRNFYLSTNDQGLRAPVLRGSPMSLAVSYTQQVWVRITGFNTFNGIMDFSPNESYAMYWEDSPLPGFIYMSETGSSVAGNAAMPAGTGTPGAPWVNVAITFNSTGVEATSTLNIYINGVLASGPITGGNGTGPAAAGDIRFIDFLTAATDTGTEYGFEGDLAIAMLYDRALSATEVLQNYGNQAGRFGLLSAFTGTNSEIVLGF